MFIEQIAKTAKNLVAGARQFHARINQGPNRIIEAAKIASDMWDASDRLRTTNPSQGPDREALVSLRSHAQRLVALYQN